MVDRSTNRSRGFGFVTFESEEAVDNVIKTENTILGKWVEVKRAEPRDMTTRFEVAVEEVEDPELSEVVEWDRVTFEVDLEEEVMVCYQTDVL